MLPITTTIEAVMRLPASENMLILSTYIDIELRENGRIARLHLTPEGKEYLSDIASFNDGCPENIEFEKSDDEIYGDLFEDIRCNSSIDLIGEYQRGEIGALTSAPMFGTEIGIGDDGKLETVGDVYWFPDYAVRFELRELLFDGYIDFVRAD